ncbi:hypothetical protein ABZ135_22025 [Streptomyces sp. NPDC006339]|uniref:phage tail protein n=1 Tax=Streptomyces sp. NPDC006339 TaxID=3156755 RepID=UPI0033B986D6
MALNVGELVALIRADDHGLRHGISEADLRLAGFQRDVNGRLRTLNGRFVDETRVMAQLVADGLANGSNAGLRRLILNVRSRMRNLRSELRSDTGSIGNDAGSGFAMRMLSRIGSAIRAGIGTAVETGMSGLQRVTQSVSSNPYVGAIGAAIVAGIIATVGPLLVTALGGLVISVAGIGVVGLGAALLKDEPEVKKAASSLAETAKRVFREAAWPMKSPMLRALEDVKAAVVDLGPSLQQMFAAAAPLVKPLTDGLTKLVQNLLPGITSALKSSEPVFEGLRDMLGHIGSGLGRMFEIIGKQPKNLGDALRDLGKLIEWTLVGLGYFIHGTAELYGTIRGFVQKIVGAFQWLYDVLVGHSIVPDLVNAIVRWFASLPGKSARALAGLPAAVTGMATSAASRMLGAVRRGLDMAVGAIRGLPGRARGALGGLAGTLYGAGQSLLRGFISGIQSMIGSLRSTLGGITSMIPDLKGPPEKDAKLLTPAGRSVIAGFQRGIAAQVPALQRQLAGITTALPGMAVGPMATAGGPHGGGGAPQPVVIELRGPGLKDVITDIVQVSGRGNVQVAFGQR